MNVSTPMPLDEPLHEITGPLVIDELIKIATLMVKPNEQMRRALRFYKAPTDIDLEANHFGLFLRNLLHFECAQDPWELEQLLELVKGRESLLEVGSCFGGTLKRMANQLAEGALVVSVDLPVDDTPKHLEPQASLKDACKRISLTGRHVELFVGDSHAEKVIAGVKRFAPFEFGFIDGDHSYAGVKADWENYGPMCKVVGFHDIAGPVEGCTRFWQELKRQHPRTREIINPGKGFGIGIVFREE